MRFDLLDEYSTVVPFGLGISRNRDLPSPAAPAEAANRGYIAGFAGRAERLRKRLGAFCQVMLSSLGHRSETRVIQSRAPNPSGH
jgi:hypothetical protein